MFTRNLKLHHKLLYKEVHLRTFSSAFNGNSSRKSATKLCAALGVGGAAVFWWTLVKKRNIATCHAEPELGISTEKAPCLTGKGTQWKYSNTNGSKIKTLEDAIARSRDLSQRIKDEVSSPGLVVAVSVDGAVVWSEGLGYADVENRVPCTPDTVMRIASISKAMTMAIAARLWQNGQLDINKPIHYYLPDYPQLSYQGEKVAITSRQLMNHTAGIRHYDRSCKVDKLKQELAKAKQKVDQAEAMAKKSEIKKLKKELEKSAKKAKDLPSEAEYEEFKNKNYYKTVTDSLKFFQNDALCSKPGTEYLYTTHGYTLISAVLESVTGLKFTVMAQNLWKDLGMENTCLDDNKVLIYNRARCYQNKHGRLINAPYVDNSYKWAGGGFLSTVKDLVKFGNVMLYSYQDNGSSGSPQAYIKQDTMKAMLAPPTGNTEDSYYGLGWQVYAPANKYNHGRDDPFNFHHSGGAMGCSSILLIAPDKKTRHSTPHAKGVVVAMIANMQSVGLYRTALKIAKEFEDVDFSQ